MVDERAALFAFKEGQGGTARTFHPKTYLFENSERALAIVGSGNLTAGGLFLNHELAVAIDLDLADEPSALFYTRLREAISVWQTPGDACLEVDAKLLRSLYESGDLLTEAVIAAGSRANRAATRRGRAANAAGRPALFGSSGASSTAPTPLPLPPMAPPAVTPEAEPARRLTQESGGNTPPPRPTRGTHATFLIEVRPHHNGEVFLSKLAIDEDPGFFGSPFSGWTTPHNPRNQPYPMLEPDPCVELVVLDERGKALVRLAHRLNVVHYTLKSEIRITLPPEPLAHIPQMSLLAMTRNPSATFDYRLEFLPPNCSTRRAKSLRAKLTRQLPSGGAQQRRRYGWA